MVFAFFYLLSGVSIYLAIGFAVRGGGYLAVAIVFGFITLIAVVFTKYFREHDNDGSIGELEGKLDMDLLAGFKQKYPEAVRKFRLTMKYFVILLIIASVLAWSYMIYFALK